MLNLGLAYDAISVYNLRADVDSLIDHIGTKPN
jgi:hypothetical protein